MIGAIPGWVLNVVVFGGLGLFVVWFFAVYRREHRERRNPGAGTTVYWRRRSDGRPGIWVTDRPGKATEALGIYTYHEYGGAIAESDGWHMYCKECVSNIPTIAPHREEAISRLLAHWNEVHGKHLRIRRRRLLGY